MVHSKNCEPVLIQDKRTVGRSTTVWEDLSKKCKTILDAESSAGDSAEAKCIHNPLQSLQNT